MKLLALATFYLRSSGDIASAHPHREVDASHRGGNPGFVQILNERSLRIPDYAGNSCGFSKLQVITIMETKPPLPPFTIETALIFIPE